MKIAALGASPSVIALFFAASVSAQTAAFKCPPAGTIVEYSNGISATWLAQEGNFCRYQQKAADGQQTVRNWYAPAALSTASTSQAWAEQFKPWTLWPLAVGKKITGRYDGPGSTAGFSGSWMHSLTVEKFAKITTKAGTFDTFVVAFEQDGISHRFKGVFRQWYAPEPGVNVKFDYSDSTGVKSSGEAISIKR
jgi:hypothetical protein